MKHDYDQGNYQTRNRSSSGDRRISFRDSVDVDLYKIIEGDCKIVIEMSLGEEILGRHKTIEVRITEVNTGTIIEML